MFNQIYLWLCLIILSSLNPAAHAESAEPRAPSPTSGFITLTVGTDDACDYDNIQMAIDAADNSGTIIRITRQQSWQEALQVNSKTNLYIWGGYADCTSDQLAGITTINVNSTTLFETGFSIVDSDVIALSNIQLLGANSGGAMSVDNSTLTLDTMLFVENKRISFIGTASGGGLRAFNGSIINVSGSQFRRNEADNGGGVYCSNSFIGFKNSIFSLNKAIGPNGKGGGIYAVNDCQINLDSDPEDENSPLRTALNSNTATYQGAGLYAGSGAMVKINKTLSNPNSGRAYPVKIDGNTVFNDGSLINSGGGGIAVDGSDTVIDAVHMIFRHNLVDSDGTNAGGGAIRVINSAQFTLKVEQPNNNCGPIFYAGSSHDPRMCNQMLNNNGGIGGVVYGDGGIISINQTFITGSIAYNGAVAYIDGGVLTMQGNLIVNNGNEIFPSHDLVSVTGFGNFIADFSTFSDNRIGSGLGTGYVVSTSQANLIHMTRSIINERAEANLFENSIDTTSIFDCLLSHETSSFSGTDINLGIPHYQQTWPYHLHELSDGVNMCKSTGALPNDVDIDGEPRGICTGIICPIIRFDAGADEYNGNDVIFKHGFEAILK